MSATPERAIRMPTSPFRYFLAPHAFSTFSVLPQICALCERECPGYDRPFYGPGSGNAEFVCEECLFAGELGRVGLTTNTGDSPLLRQQLMSLYPHLSEVQVEDIVLARTAELEQRTPLLITWQELHWPAHCGDYMRFVKEVGKADLNALSANGDGRAFLNDHLAEDQHEHTDLTELWDSVRADSPQDGPVAYHVGVWLFECLQCARHVILWDCD